MSENCPETHPWTGDQCLYIAGHTGPHKSGKWNLWESAEPRGLPKDAKARKQLQLYTYMFGYFPDAWLATVDVARKGNEQHNPGQPLHWAREKSTDQMNAAFNHIFDYGTGNKRDTDGCWHLAKAIWRLSAQLQLDIEHEERDGANNKPE